MKENGRKISDKEVEDSEKGKIKKVEKSNNLCCNKNKTKKMDTYEKCIYKTEND